MVQMRCRKVRKRTEAAPLKAESERSCGFVKIEIMDTGIGIQKEARKRLFQPYSQADAGISKYIAGCGYTSLLEDTAEPDLDSG